MHRVFCLCLLFMSYSAPVISGVRIGNSHIVLESDSDSVGWGDTEAGAIRVWLASLPAQLLDSGEDIKLYKSHSSLSTHSMDEDKISVEMGDATDLRRSLLHALLHVYAERSHVADDPKWRAISGWGGRLAPLWISADNQDVRAYASRLGMQSPEEDFVTVAEQYFLPADTSVEDSIMCRVGKKYRYLEQRFAPYKSAFERAGIRCETIDRGFLEDLRFISPVTGERLDIGPVNADSVSGFELLYATPGSSDAAEIAGHLLLRIKLNNNPEAQRLGYENPKDLVISFLADTQPLQTGSVPAKPLAAMCETGLFNTRDNQDAGLTPMLRSVWQALKGLSGGFLTLMDRQTLGQTIKHYTLDEDRNLLRFALKLDRRQKEQLLDFLFQAKKNYKSEYYFFSNNCASVLVKIIGRGIGDEDIARFNPWVSPPNALVALFLRHGLAQPVYPSFYSFRQQGQIAQDAASRYYQQLLQRYPDRAWPRIDDVFFDDDDKRSAAIVSLRDFSRHNRDIQASLWQLSQLIHQADLTYSFRDQTCQQITPQSTAEIRRWQRAFSQSAFIQDASALQAVNYQIQERRSFANGVPHTKLLNVKMAANYALGDGNARAGLRVGAAFMQQEMGSMANIAMQRSSSVDLGSFEGSVYRDPVTGDLDVDDWRFSGLTVRKFRQRLSRVPGFFSNAGKLGVGLNVLKLQADNQADLLHGSLFGAETLFNLYSTHDNDDHAFVSLGMELHRHIEHGRDRLGLMAPVYVQTLNSWGAQRRLQWRNHFEIRYGKPEQIENEWDLQSRFGYRLALKKSMALLFVSAERWHWAENAPDRAAVSIGVEWDRF